eukprot:1319664-Amphidinium_carterae.1
MPLGEAYVDVGVMRYGGHSLDKAHPHSVLAGGKTIDWTLLGAYSCLSQPRDSQSPERRDSRPSKDGYKASLSDQACLVRIAD